MQVDDIDVFIGIDVGKSEHWATALTTAGECLHDRPLPNDEARLREVYEHLGEHGRLLVVGDGDHGSLTSQHRPAGTARETTTPKPMASPGLYCRRSCACRAGRKPKYSD